MRRDEGWKNDICKECFTNHMILNVNVLGPAVEFWVFYKTEGTLIVSEQRSG